MRLATIQIFSNLCHLVGVPREAVTDSWKNLCLHYSEGHRSYHTLEHIDRMLGWLESTAPGNIAIEFAIWYHDVIYDPRSARNEILSAEYFRAGIGVHLEPALVSEVSRLILATDHRSHRSYSHDEALLIDIDLSILGGDTELYDEYNKAIRLEYSHVPDDAYCEGRSAVLTGFLENTIFTTLPFLKLEANARNNILREVAALNQQKANKALHPTAGNAPV